MTYRHPQGTSLGNHPAVDPKYHEETDPDILRPGDFMRRNGVYFEVIHSDGGSIVTLKRIDADHPGLVAARGRK